MTPAEFTSAFHHNFHIDVAWGDMDAMGHVNNTKYFRYYESGRVDFLQQYEHLLPMPGIDIGPILAFIDCQFSLPLTFPDKIIVGSRITDIGNTSIKLEQAIYSTVHGKIGASSKSVIVLINYQTGEKVAVPAHIRDHFRDTHGAGDVL
jgi:acyl-CoA thioester hydrolase